MTNDIELQQLRCFVAVAEMLSFGKAARLLHVSQPPLSRQIGRLERSIGVTLLNRSPQGVSLKASGVIFLAEAKQILQRVDCAGILARQAESGDIGKLTVGCSSYLDLAINRFLATRPGNLAEVGLRLQTLTSPDQVFLLQNHILDAGIIRLPAQDIDHLTLELLCTEPVVAMVSTTHPFSERDHISLSELAGLAVMIPHQDSAPLVSHQIRRICLQASPRIHFLESPENLYSLIQSVEISKVVALLPAAVRYASLPQSVQLIPFHEDCARLGVGVLFRRSYDSPALDRFLDTIRQFPLDFSLGDTSNGFQGYAMQASPPSTPGLFA